ncbi:MAG TPA: lipase maturation factor family protein [Gammaproteobacteria bacterium]|nr:lipase maturation factor family protein [Gammaproteobacteria bacterium]
MKAFDSLFEPGYRLVAALFLRLLGLFYLIAFISLGSQVQGLAGSEGIIPIAELLDDFATRSGIERYVQIPTLFWLNASDAALNIAIIAGCAAAVLILLQRWTRAALVAAYLLYLSFYHACQPFLHFQWDGLLLEAGFLAIFLTPHSRVVILLFRWLLFKLRFMSGLAKLTYNDPAWSGLTALNTYFEVQPLPNPLSWYAHHLPEWLLRVGTAGTLVVELLVPFMMFMPRRWRFVAAWITILWQVLIILTSNHNWFNFLTIALCLFLFDDRALQRVLPGFLWNRLDWPTLPVPHTHILSRSALGLLAGLILVVSAVQLWDLNTHKGDPNTPLGSLVSYAETFRIANKYHVFPTMTTRRIELEVEGSMDGREWRPYQFRYKPQALDERPRVIIPHQPRLDWQMWFVPLHPKYMPWFESFLYALLENSPTVTALLRDNPFPDAPPRYLRVLAWDYRFTDAAERAATGNWWRRESLGPFRPLPWVFRKPDGETGP